MDQVAATSLVLVVEDETLIRMGLVVELTGHGFHVLEAADAPTAMTLFRDHPALESIVVDIGLAGEETGYDVVQAMRRTGATNRETSSPAQPAIASRPRFFCSALVRAGSVPAAGW